MDNTKCRELKVELATQPEPQLVSAEHFFDGNDDLGSIGCNLPEHPGVEVFRNTFLGLLQRVDVQAVYVQIAELDPGESCWPFADIVLVVGEIPVDELRRVVRELEPDEVSTVEAMGLARPADTPPDVSVLAIWWD